MTDTDRRPVETPNATMQLASGSAMVMTGLYLSTGLQFAQLLLLSHVLGNAGIGLVSLALRTVALIETLIIIGIPTMLTRNLAASDDHETGELMLSTAVAFILPMSVLGALSTLIAAPYISLTMNDSRIGSLVALLGLSLPFSSLSALSLAYLRGKMQFGKYSTVIIVSPILSLLLVILWVGSLNPEVAVFCVLIGSVGSSFAGLKYARPKTRRLLRTAFAKSILLPGLPLLFLALAGTYMDSVDAIVLQVITADVGIVGIYSNAYSLAAYLRYLVEPLALVLLPVASKALALQDPAAASTIASSSLRMVVVFFTPLAFLFAALSDEVLSILLPSAFLQGSLPLTVLSLSAPCLACYYVFSRLLIAAGKTTLLSLLVGASLLVGFIVKVALTIFLGMLGTALSSALSFTVMAVATGAFLNRTTRVELKLTRQAFLGPLSAVVISFGLKHLLNAFLAPIGLTSPLVIITAVCIGLYATEILVKPLSKEEADLIVNSIAVLPLIGRLLPLVRRIIRPVTRI